jgi:hypothetical protein
VREDTPGRGGTVSDKAAAQPLKAPYPAFGGKSAIAGMVWERIGDVRNAIEPFCFSLAWILNRPHEAKIETVNDLNPFVANFWRAIQCDPEAVARWADWPVNETDLHARHRWLVQSRKARASLARVKADPDYFDAKIAGWWCWGACMWIGSGWCDSRGVNSQQIPKISDEGADIHVAMSAQVPHLAGDAGVVGQKVTSSAAWKKFDAKDVHQKRPRVPSSVGGYAPGVINGVKRPQLCNGNTTHGVGVHADSSNHRPQLADAYSRGRGVHGNDALTDCQRRRLWLVDWFTRLADRLRPVRVCCGHWMRVCDSDSTLTRLGLTGVFLDPPYRKTLADGTVNRAANIYANDKSQDVNALCDEVQDWCLRWDGNPEIRIALCGLEGEYPLIDAAGWEKVPWKSRGGYGNRTDRGKENAARERIWFNKSCLDPDRALHTYDHHPCGSAATGRLGVGRFLLRETFENPLCADVFHFEPAILAPRLEARTVCSPHQGGEAYFVIRTHGPFRFSSHARECYRGMFCRQHNAQHNKC